MINPPWDHNGAQLTLPLISAPGRVRPVSEVKGDFKVVQVLGCVPMYPRFGMGDPWVTQYVVCCCLPFFVYHFSAEKKNGYRQPQAAAKQPPLCPSSRKSSKAICSMVPSYTPASWCHGAVMWGQDAEIG